jgi:hypothetical protein
MGSKSSVCTAKSGKRLGLQRMSKRPFFAQTIVGRTMTVE